MIGRNPYRALERALGYRFRRKRWLEQAITHPSFSHEQPERVPDNQRMEFLGDAALGLVAAARLFESNPSAAEGTLTKMRSLITSTKALAEVAQRIDLGAHLRLGRGEERGGGRIRASILADAFEAVLGAAYLDGGVKAVEKIFRTLFSPGLEATASVHRRENPKGALQEWSQRGGTGMPHYHVIHEEGPPHQRIYTVEVRVAGEVRGTGAGPTKRDAETQAAIQALDATDSQY